MLRTLGKLALENNALTRPKTLSLLAYLALEGRKPRTHVRQLFFGNASDAAASLRVVLQQLRNTQALLEEQKNLACAMPCDATQILEKLDRGDEAAAVELYTGEFLAGVQFDSAEFEEWVLVTREHIASRVQKAHLHLALAALEKADLPKAAQQAVAAYTLAKTTPLETEDLLTLLGIFEDCSHDLAATLRQELLDLKISIPNRSKVTVRHLPSAISGFVFRSEQTALEKLLQDQRLITIFGYGGAGKSRLALEVLRALPEDTNPFFVPLEPIIEPTDVIPACLRAMSYRESSSNPLEQLQNQIGQKNVVLLLDNAEHLISIGTMLETLLESCPNLRILLTSRERLGVLGETVFPLGGFADDESALELLDLACRRTGTVFTWQTKTALKICNALERFPLAIELAAAMIGVLPLTEILEALQQHLDALETSHGRERHRSMRAVFNWSWSLLSNPQRQGLMRLAVFRDGFSRVAALQVMGSNLTVIAALVSKSLVQNLQNGRYRLHPLIAQYSLEALEGIPKEAKTAKAAHAEVFLAWLEQNAPLVRTAQAGVVLGAFETDLENIKSAWGWLCEHPDLGRFDRLQDLVSLFDARARFEEGVQLFEAAIRVLEPKMALGEKAGAEDVELINALGSLRINAAWLLSRIHLYVKALHHAEEAHDVLQNSGDSLLKLKVFNVLGTIARDLSKHELALQNYQLSASVAKKLDLPLREAMAKQNLGIIYMYQGKYIEALNIYFEAKQIYSKHDDIKNLLHLNLSLVHILIFCMENKSQETYRIILETAQKAEEIEELYVLQFIAIYKIFFYTMSNQINNAEKQIALFSERFKDSIDSIRALYKIALAEFYLKTSDLLNAEKAIINAVKVAYDDKLEQTLQHALVVLAQFYLKKNELEKASHTLTYLTTREKSYHWLCKKSNDTINENRLRLMLSTSFGEQLPWLN